jgi:CubicO group peptidase (beta-lactamase class C family)
MAFVVRRAREGGSVFGALLLAALVCFGCAPAPSDPPGDRAGSEAVSGGPELERLIPDLMTRARVPGLQIALIRDGRIVLERGFGTTGGPGSQTVDADTVFEAASLTKPLFAYLVMTLVDEGVVDLERPILGYLPPERVEGALGHGLDADGFRRDWFETITARHVLSHSAGLPHGDGGAVTTVFFEPGSDWKYSAEGYGYLQLAVEHLTGEPLDRLADERVLRPLGMDRSSMVWRDDLEARMARGHDVFGEPAEIRKRSEPTAAASLYTTAGDYARFVLAIIDGTGLAPATHRRMLDWIVDMSDDGSVGWSLGFGLQRDDRGVAFWQWGDYGIFRDYVLASADDNNGIVYLTNSFNGLALCDELVRTAVGRPPLGCLELEYQQVGSPFYELFWTAKDEGAHALAENVPAAVATDPEFLDTDRLAGMAGVLAEEGLFEEAEVLHRFNLEQHPGSGAMLFNLARHFLVAGDFERAGPLFEQSLIADENPADAEQVEWLTGYMRALHRPVPIAESSLALIAGDYGPRHLRARDGRLYYSRDNVDASAQRQLFAESEDTFVLEGVTYFKLRVIFGDDGIPTELVGLYDSGRRDVSPRDG